MIVGILQARTSSSRLPGKVVKEICGKPMIMLHLERLHLSKNLDKIIVATSDLESDDRVAEVCQDAGVDCYRGSLENVLSRYYGAAEQCSADQIVRLTADCPLADWEVIDQAVNLHNQGQYNFTSNTIERTFPDGLDVEVIPFDMLHEAHANATTTYQKEHVTPYVVERLDRLRYAQITQDEDLSMLRWTVDTAEDFELVRLVYEALYETKKTFSSQDVLGFLLENEDVRNINADEAARRKYLELVNRAKA